MFLPVCLALSAAGLANPLFFRHAAKQNRHTPHDYIYVNCGAIEQFRVGDDGQLVRLNPASVPTNGRGAYVYVGPDGRHLYAPVYDNQTVAQYRINPDGTLEPLTPPSVPAGKFSPYLAFSSDGRAAYATNITGDSVSTGRSNP